MDTLTLPTPDTVEVLIAEDSPTQAAQLRYLLEQHGYRVTVAGDGRQALVLASEHQPSLVISDIVMPEIDGFELCRRLKADERTWDIPVVLLTVLSDPEDVLAGLVCGADSLITKPYNAGYLLTYLERTLAGKSRRSREHPDSEVEITLAGKTQVITIDPQRIVSLLLSSYGAAVHRNAELVRTQDELSSLNDRMEDLVEERTAELSAEIVERKRVEAEREVLLGRSGNKSNVSRGYWTPYPRACS